jgi:uncharacterized protein (DUF305 family)
MGGILVGGRMALAGASVPVLATSLHAQQPYWIGLLVHMASASMYPVFGWLRYPLGRAPDTPDVVTAKAWGAAALAIIAMLTSLAIFGSLDRELPWIGTDAQSDQSYIRHMTTHHAQGVELAYLAVGRARDPHLRSLAMLMVASQTGEVRIFERWWRSWFDAPMPLCSAPERAAMPGLLSDGQMQQVRSAPPGQFDGVFIQLMSIHHAGAVKMADQAWRGHGDPRLRAMAHAIRHEQQGEIALMRGTSGFAAVYTALRNMIAENANR